MTKITKRSSLFALLVLALGLVLSACGDPTATPAVATTAATSATTAAATTAAGAATTAAGAATTAAAGTTAASATTAAAAAAGGTLDRVVIGQGVDPTTLDPQNHNETPAFNILNNIYETLVTFDRNGKLQPRLAESWKQLDDLNLEMKLRKGVKWHDGTDFTADDVKFTIDRYINSNKEPDALKRLKRAGNLNFVSSVTVTDPLTVKITTEKPSPLLLPKLIAEGIVSKKFVTEKGEQAIGLSAMGTGAYKFVEWKKDNYLDMDANTEWWGAPGGPKAKKVRFRPIPDAQTRISALQAGEVDIIVNVAPEQAKQLETGAKTGVSSVPSVRVIFITLNTLDDSPAPALKNVKVRQALNYAIDRDAIITNIMLGNGKKISSPINSYFFAYEDLPQYNYDPAKAKALLTEAGFPNGFDLELTTPNGRYLKDKEIGEAVTEYWGKIGVKVKFAAEPFASVFIPKVDSRKQTPAFLLGWGNSTYDPDGTLFDQFVGPRYSYYKNPDFNKLIEEARSIVDQKKREELYKQANKILNQDAPWIFLHQQNDIYGISKRIKWQARPDEQLNAFEITGA